eukprot:SAG31_NODE_6701_length_1919_cov_1.388462_2_plen_112_part_00
MAPIFNGDDRAMAVTLFFLNDADRTQKPYFEVPEYEIGIFPKYYNNFRRDCHRHAYPGSALFKLGHPYRAAPRTACCLLPARAPAQLQPAQNSLTQENFSTSPPPPARARR